MSANRLLMKIVMETGKANALVEQIARHASTHEVVLAHEIMEAAASLDEHLRAASCAAAALRSLTQGNPEPPCG